MKFKEAKKGYLDDEGKFYDYRTQSVTSDKYIDETTTGVPYYDEFLNPTYAKRLESEDNLVGKIVMMSPEEYFQECANNIFSGPSAEDLKIQRGEYDRKIIDHLKEVILTYKRRFPMPYLNYTGSRGQEGLHRMLCLAELTSWDTKFPVLVITYADEERAARIAKAKEINRLRIKISSAIQDALRYKYANIDEFKEQLQYSLDREWEWMDLPSPTFTLEDDGEYYIVRVGEAEEDFLKSSIKIEERPELEIDEDDLDIDDFDLEETEDFLRRYFGDDWRETHPHLKDTFKLGESLQREDTYYRLELIDYWKDNCGGIFTSKALWNLIYNGDEEWEELEDIIDDLMSNHKVPDRWLDNVKFAFKKSYMDANKDKINELSNLLKEADCELLIKEIKNPNIVWEDELQIAYVED